MQIIMAILAAARLLEARNAPRGFAHRPSIVLAAARIDKARMLRSWKKRMRKNAGLRCKPIFQSVEDKRRARHKDAQVGLDCIDLISLQMSGLRKRIDEITGTIKIIRTMYN